MQQHGDVEEAGAAGSPYYWRAPLRHLPKQVKALPKAALAFLVGAPLFSALMVWMAFAHQPQRVPKSTPEVENLGVLGVLVPTAAGGGASLLDALERLYEQRTELENPGTVEVSERAHHACTRAVLTEMDRCQATALAKTVTVGAL
jgi:hypothetical protein